MIGRRLTALALASCLCSIGGTVFASGLDPEAAASKRAELVAEQPEDPRAAIDHFERAGEELGDPELFMLAAKAAHAEAERVRDETLALECSALASLARDIALHLVDERNYAATDWHPITAERARDLAEQAATLAAQAEQLAETIVAERAAAEAEARRLAEESARADDERRPARPGTGLIAGGSVMLTIGAGGLGMIGAGVALGQARQRDAEALVLPDQLDQLDELDRQGAQANIVAFAGIGVATLGVAVGVALIVVGVKKRKAGAEEPPTAGLGRGQWLVGGWANPDSGGLALSGRF